MNVTVAWDPSSGNVGSYRLYSRPATTQVYTSTNVALATSFTVSVSATVDTIFYATAIGVNGLESLPSNLATNKAILPPGSPPNFRITGGVITGMISVPLNIGEPQQQAESDTRVKALEARIKELEALIGDQKSSKFGIYLNGTRAQDVPWVLSP